MLAWLGDVRLGVILTGMHRKAKQVDHAAASPADILMRCFTAAVHAVQPERALRAPLRESTPSVAPCWIISVGKASHGMARAIVEWLAEHGRGPAGGIIIAADALGPVHPSLRALVGDHPIPSDRSARAANAIAETIERIPPGAEVHIAISGGASALMAGPLPPLSTADVTATFELLLASGLDIQAMNAVRKRVTRWSAGRLALQLAARTLRVWVISDVISDDLGSIASGPCTGDRWTRADVAAMLSRSGHGVRLPVRVQAALLHETPKPDNPWLATITPRIVATNGMAVAAALKVADSFGVRASASPAPLHGEAAEMGRTIAATMAAHDGARGIVMWGGETTVTIVGNGGTGGRLQELALAAAEQLRGRDGTLLAAGTDGRDGPTDAAGAVVDGDTWNRIVGSGRDPAADLARHDAYPSLKAAGALVHTGATGTNVMDVAFAVTGWP